MDTDYPGKPQNAQVSAPLSATAEEMVRRGHETTDVSVRGLFIFAGALLISLVVILAGLVVVFKGYQWADRALDLHDTRRQPGSESRVHFAPQYAGPLLQVKPEEDLAWMKTNNAAALGHYGWVDRAHGVVQLPVERAMDLIAERGLPPISPGLTLEAIQRQRADPQVWGQALRP